MTPTARLGLLVGAAVAVGTLSLGLVWMTLSRISAHRPGIESAAIGSSTSAATTKPTQVQALVDQPAAVRRPTLEAIAAGKTGTKGDRAPARYLLASDLIASGEAEAALDPLKRLEEDYPVLAPYVLVKRAEAYDQAGQADEAEATWQALLQRHGDHPAAAAALYALGHEGEGDYWQQALEKFPAHPKTVAWAKAKLAETPDQPDLLLLLARHALYRSDAEATLDQLTEEFGDQLQPEDWERIGFGYWEMQRYGKAGDAYAQAPPTALNLYRAGRGAHLEGEQKAAIARYQTLNRTFPEAEQTAQALLHLANLVELEESLGYTNRVVEAFPDRAAEALLLRTELLELLNSPDSAQQARQSILSQYGSSETAAEIRWERAQQVAEAGDLDQAWRWGRDLLAQNPDAEQAPAAAFWMGRWAAQLDQPDVARAAFEYILQRYPESYYAWRSATTLGWDVGDFSSARYKQPELAVPVARSPLPAGSKALQALYQLGQDEDAWELWQAEYDNPTQPTVAQQMTDGLLRLGVGDNLEGIFMLSSLSWRAEETDDFSLADAKTSPAYWQGRYPTPFRPLIEEWAVTHRLNPALVMALIRQESRFETDIRSSADAVGLMQVIPPTADWVAGQLGLETYDLTKPEDNIQLGTWYLNYTHQEYDDNSLYAVASYNAGPGSVADWIARFNTTDADRFVAQIPFPETKGYVRSVFENYWNYLRLYNPAVRDGLAALATTDAADLTWSEALPAGVAE
ncbi:MAG: transglycosylase SLT domain-containing protein [Cyanobacteria bacterium P01_A01_bin.135]